MVRSGTAGGLAVVLAGEEAESDGVEEGVSAASAEMVGAVPVPSGRVSMALLWLDLRATPTRMTSSTTNATMTLVVALEETLSLPISARQRTKDGGHGLDYLLCHGGEHLFFAPERVHDVGL
jgi:hypothetical protein